MNAPTGSNIYSTDLDDNTKQILKGDTIGDTLYSESFVLRTLLQLSDLKWNSEIEDDLCFLWDMTTEEDVCSYLFKLEFPALVCNAIMRHSEKSRFLEIIIGILANIFCAKCEKNIKEYQIIVVLTQLDSDDSLVLIQVNRFIVAVADSRETLPFITYDEIDSLIFILNNSVNNTLILKTLESVSKITEDFKLEQELVSEKLFEAVITAFDTVINVDSQDFEVNTSNQTVIRLFLEIITQICGYVHEFTDNDLALVISSSEKCTRAMEKLLEYFSIEENLFPIHTDFYFYVQAICYIIVTVNYNFVDSIFISFCKILYFLKERKDADMLDVLREICEIIEYFISAGNQELVLPAIKKLSDFQRISVLMLIIRSQTKLDIDMANKLKSLF